MCTNNQSERGFVLVEAIVAIGICILMVVGALGLMQRSIEYTRQATDQTIATYLAQDVMEWIVAKHEYNEINNQGWLAGFDTSTDCTSPPQPCDVDTSLPVAGTSLTSQTNNALLFDPLTGEYGYAAGWTISPYTRTVDVTQSGPEATVTVSVSWNTGSRSNSVSINHRLYQY